MLFSPETPTEAAPVLLKPSEKREAVENAQAYLERVRAAFASEPQLFDKFLDIMQNYMSRDSDTEAMQRARLLFSNHPELYEGFRKYLRKEDERMKEYRRTKMKLTPQQIQKWLFSNIYMHPIHWLDFGNWRWK